MDLNVYLVFFAGLMLLTVCGDWLVDGAARLSLRLKLSTIFVGVVVVGFGTSFPEILATAVAVHNGRPDLGLGNVIGSNIANIGLILGVGMVLMCGHLGFRKAKRDYGLMLFATAVLCSFAIWGHISLWHGVTLLLILAATIVYMLRGAKVDTSELPKGVAKEPIIKPLWHVLIGLIGLMIGAELTVEGSSAIATSWGVSQRVIGLTLMAVGTSLPELAATIAAARRKEGGLVVGNILGSNIINIFGALGVASLFGTICVQSMGIDLMVMAGFAVFLLPMMLKKHERTRGNGIGLLILYTLYIAWLAYGSVSA